MTEDASSGYYARPPGHPGAPGAPPHPGEYARVDAPGVPVTHRPWSTLLLVVHSLGVVAGTLVALGGVVIFTIAATAEPPRDTGINEPWGLVIGAVMAIVGVAMLVASIPLTVLSVRGRRAADHGSPGMLHGVAIAVVAIGGIGVLGQLATGDLVISLFGLVLWGLYALLGFLVLRSTRTMRLA